VKSMCDLIDYNCYDCEVFKNKILLCRKCVRHEDADKN